jgi:AcrR family transcriptional regulator
MRITQAAKDATRNRILEAAQRQFAEQGFEAATTRDLAHAANIAIGTLFNYFPTKESIVEHLVSEACRKAAERFAKDVTESAHHAASAADGKVPEGDSLEEELFANIAQNLRALKPYRKYLPAVLETSFSLSADGAATSSRNTHLESVEQIISRHLNAEALSAVGLHLYWTLFTGVLAFWSQDKSPRQEDTLALMDESMAMFCGWLSNQPSADRERSARRSSNKNER